MGHDTLSKTVRIDLTEEAAPSPCAPNTPPARATPTQAEPLPVDSDELFHCVYEAAFITNSAGTILKVNDRAAQLFGYEPDVFSGANVTEVIMGADDTLLGQINQNLDSDRFTLIEATCVRNGGRDFHAEISVSRLTIAGEEHFLFFVRDITVRRRRQARLSQLNKMLRSLQRVSQVLGDQQDLETMLQEICGSLVESGRYSAAWICLVDADDNTTTFAGEGQSELLAELKADLSSGTAPPCLTATMARDELTDSRGHTDGGHCCRLEGECLSARLSSHGRVFGVLSVGVPPALLEDEQELDSFRQLATDISTALYANALEQERRQTKQRLIEAKDELEQRVQERTAQLASSNDELIEEIKERKHVEEELRWAVTSLQQHDEARTQFVYNVSHELRTPLTSISYFVNNMRQGITGEISPKARDYLRLIHEDCQRLEGTVEDILDLSRLETDRLQLVRTPLPFVALTRRTVESLRMQAETEQKRLALQLDPREAFVECDSKRIERVITNLVKNAIKFTGNDGDIRVAVTRLCDDETDRVCLTVTDNGVGIPQEHIGRVTERYYRIGEHVSGTGLGLSICKDLVELHDGTLTLESPPRDESRGTRVTVCLPCIPPADLLVIGMSDSVNAALVATLTDAGYGATCTHDLHAVAATVAERRPAAVLLAWLEDDMEPGAVIATLRTAGTDTDLPILAVTGPTPPPMQQEILNGFDIERVDYPVQHDALFDALEQTLARPSLQVTPPPAEGVPPDRSPH